jgi:hypothetical protein
MTQVGTVTLTLEVELEDTNVRIHRVYHTTSARLPADVHSILHEGAEVLHEKWNNIQNGGQKPHD